MKLPEPWRLTISPFNCIARRASRIVARLTRRRPARARSEGRRSPGFNRPCCSKPARRTITSSYTGAFLALPKENPQKKWSDHLTLWYNWSDHFLWPELYGGRRPVSREIRRRKRRSFLKKAIMEKALEGIRVLDMTHVQSGPACTQLLAWFGADVIKIERPGEGDPTRSQLRDIPDADSLYFTMLNSNKRSITLNPKTPEGKRILTKLIEMCDVMVENFAPGAIERMGFPWETIQQINPRMIYA